MIYRITEIEFDFDDEVHPDEQAELYEEILGSVWQAGDSDDLIEEITTATGWCIKSIDYIHILC